MDQEYVVNETAREVVALPENYFNSKTYAILAYEATDTRQQWVPVTPVPDQQWSLLGYTICGKRSLRALDGRLVVDGRAIKPESYIKLWRKQFGNPLSANEFEARTGLRLKMRFDFDLAVSFTTYS